MDAKVCPDGSSVGRVAPSCEFAPCPLGDTTTNVTPIPEVNETPLVVNTTPENMSTEPCNYNDTSIRYVQKDSNTCKTVLLNCMGNEQNFTNACGCGCAKVANATVAPNVTFNNSKPANTTVTFEQPQLCVKRNADYCSANYEPVCGWFNASIQCIKYPCAQTYSNTCVACRDEKVANWTSGECPTMFNASRGY